MKVWVRSDVPDKVARGSCPEKVSKGTSSVEVLGKSIQVEGTEHAKALGECVPDGVGRTVGEGSVGGAGYGRARV